MKGGENMKFLCKITHSNSFMKKAKKEERKARCTKDLKEGVYHYCNAVELTLAAIDKDLKRV